jgi:hypothetical protein
LTAWGGRWHKALAVARSVRHGGREPLVPPTAAVAIAPLISPLRYDVIIRARHFDFHSEHRDLYVTDREAYVALAQATPYYTWFVHIVCPAYFPEVLGRPDAVTAAFAERLDMAAALLESFETKGFDASSPILLRAGTADTHTATSGKLIAGSHFAGDGCHRLALLWRSGRQQLEPSEFLLRVDSKLVPKDHTARLLEVLSLDDEEYFSFLSLRYGGGDRFTTRAALLASLQSSPLLAEVEGLLRVDDRIRRKK